MATRCRSINARRSSHAQSQTIGNITVKRNVLCLNTTPIVRLGYTGAAGTRCNYCKSEQNPSVVSLSLPLRQMTDKFPHLRRVSLLNQASKMRR
jgi:hypothetical protein